MKAALILPTLIAMLVPFPTLSFQTKAPTYFVDKGACPFECCAYGKWKTAVTTVAYARPDKRSKRIGKLKAGSKVTALTGQVQTTPSRFVVKKPHERYKPGDVIWVYTYLGEGLFKVWFNGKMYEENLEFSPYGGSMGKRCEVDNLCWGELDKDLQMTWWIKIKSPDGWIGWTNQGEHFSGADLCG